MASVILISPANVEVTVDTTRDYNHLVYNMGYVPKTGTIEENYEILLAGFGSPGFQVNDFVRVSDLANRHSDALRVLDNHLVPFWAPGETVVASDVRMGRDGQIIRRTADGVTRPTYDATEAAAWTVVSGSGGAGGTTDPEVVRDTVASFIQAGANTTVTHDDAGNTLTIAMVPPALDLELVRDTVALMVRAGTGMSVVHDDAANALILSSTGGSGGVSAGFIDGGTPAAPPSDTIDGGTP